MPTQDSELPHKYRRVELSSEGPVLRSAPLDPEIDLCSVVLRLLRVGVCRSDLKEVAGRRAVRRDFGHELVGRVVRSGTEARLPRDLLVTFDPHVPVERTSGFAEWMVASGSQHSLRRAFPALPGGGCPDRWVFTEPLACAQHCVHVLMRRLGASRLDGHRVAVVGAGNAGCLIAFSLRDLGAEIVLYNRGGERLSFLARAGAFSSKALRPLSAPDERGFSVVVAATSFLVPEVVAASLRLLAPGGLLLLYAGTSPDDPRADLGLDLDTLRRREGVATTRWRGKSVRVAGTYGAEGRDFERAISRLDRAPERFPVERLITRRIRLGEVPLTLREMAFGEAPPGKVVVDLRGS